MEYCAKSELHPASAGLRRLNEGSFRRRRGVLADFSSLTGCTLQANRRLPEKRCLAVTERSLIAYQLTKLRYRSHGGAILGRLSGEPLK
jgi:hypothetical protein